MIAWTVGQRVAVGDDILTVERVTPSGMPVVSGKMYGKNGRTRGSRSWPRDCVVPLTTELEAEITERKAIITQSVRWRKLCGAVARNLPQWGRDAWITADQLRRICDTVQAILAEQKQ